MLVDTLWGREVCETPTEEHIAVRNFITEQNVDHYLSMLHKSEMTLDQRKTLQKLLTEEMDLLPRNGEQFELADRRVHEGKQWIRKLKQTIAEWNSDERQRNSDLSLAQTMETTQQLLEGFHSKLRDELYPFCILLQTTMVGVCVSLDEARRHAQRFADANPKLVVTIIDRSSGDSHVVSPES